MWQLAFKVAALMHFKLAILENVSATFRALKSLIVAMIFQIYAYQVIMFY